MCGLWGPTCLPNWAFSHFWSSCVRWSPIVRRTLRSSAGGRQPRVGLFADRAGRFQRGPGRMQFAHFTPSKSAHKVSPLVVAQIWPGSDNVILPWLSQIAILATTRRRAVATLVQFVRTIGHCILCRSVIVLFCSHDHPANLVPRPLCCGEPATTSLSRSGCALLALRALTTGHRWRRLVRNWRRGTTTKFRMGGQRRISRAPSDPCCCEPGVCGVVSRIGFLSGFLESASRGVSSCLVLAE